jgi:sugar O-acyltransferase (sialic acid O-acetyltransferase NeuD family)
MRSRLAIVGAGGHGRELLDIVRSHPRGTYPFDVAGVVADDVADPSLLVSLGVEWLGPVDDALSAPSFELALVGVGDADARRTIAGRLSAAGVRFPSVIDASAHVGRDVELGGGSAVWPMAALSTHIRIGSHSHINQAASVSHDVVLGDFVTVAPNATLCGNVAVGDGAWIGAAACVLEGRVVGEGALVGAGALVTHDVEPWTVVTGAPARRTRAVARLRGAS